MSLMDLRGKRGYRDQEGRSRSGSNGFSNDEEGAYLGGTLGIKFVGRLADSTGMEVVEVRRLLESELNIQTLEGTLGFAYSKRGI